MKSVVFLLQHVHELPDGQEDVKVIGIYRSRSEADFAIERAKCLPGFRDSPEGFDTQEYELGKDHWIEGFVGSEDG